MEPLIGDIGLGIQEFHPRIFWSRTWVGTQLPDTVVDENAPGNSRSHNLEDRLFSAEDSGDLIQA
jgi:hypothetical protein